MNINEPVLLINKYCISENYEYSIVCMYEVESVYYKRNTSCDNTTVFCSSRSDCPLELDNNNNNTMQPISIHFHGNN